ncbi:MAG TPA: NAD-dependent epimerase/dehydratase family protein [Acidimicrobiia bacterium]
MHALVTGGAGFIGSHLVEALLARGDRVRVFDDLSNGFADNVAADADLVVGDVSDYDAVTRAVQDVDIVFHQAGLGSVSRSIEAPRHTDTVNAHGTLVVLDAARQAGVRRVVVASSSSVYGGAAPLPTKETHPVLPRSPYAVTKLVAEQYCRVFHELLGVETVSLRYFNIYGPRQRADSPYAAVIPLFVDALRSGRRPVIHGDGLQSRDFTFVADAVQANLAAAEAPVELCGGKVYNVAGGEQHSVLDLLGVLAKLLGVEADPQHTDPRPGDVRHSHADLEAARVDLGYQPKVGLEEGLRRTLTDGE